MGRGFEWNLSKEDIQMTSKYIKRSSALLVIREVRVEIMRYYFAPRTCNNKRK